MRYTNNLKQKNSFKKVIVSLFVLLLIVPVNSYAATISDAEQIQECMSNTSRLLERAILKSYDEAESNVKKLITEKNYDYYLTMESFNQQKNPYKNQDYNKLITAYIISKKYCNETNFYNMDFIKESVMEKTTDDGIIYGEISLIGMNETDIFKMYELSDNKDVKKEYYEQLEKINKYVNGVGLSQGTFITIPRGVDENTQTIINTLLTKNMSETQNKLVMTAISIIDKVPYEWGGKSTMAGYDTSWYTLNSNGQQKGLDCSGYIQWVFRTAGVKDEIWKNLSSTQQILLNTETIEKEVLEIGDLGLLNNGNTINHVGMYLGDNYWIHCSSEYDTVVIEQTDMFTIFKKNPVTVLEHYPENNEMVSIYNENNSYEDQEIYLLAQLIYNEANIEGLNGWIAVAEVVRNRINSDSFPNTIREVIYAPGQFSDSEKIVTRKPSKEQIQVAKEVMQGNLSIFGNPNVLFFRNAKRSTEDWGNYKFFSSINNHQFYLLNKEG